MTSSSEEGYPVADTVAGEVLEVADTGDDWDRRRSYRPCRPNPMVGQSRGNRRDRLVVVDS